MVLDTGILIAALISSDTPPDLIYRAWRKKAFDLITSKWQLEEFRRVSRYPRLRKYLKPSEAGDLVNGLRHQATVLKELPEVQLSPDPDDNPILATAIAGGFGRDLRHLIAESRAMHLCFDEVVRELTNDLGSWPLA